LCQQTVHIKAFGTYNVSIPLTPLKRILYTQFALSFRRSYSTTTEITRVPATKAKKSTTAKAATRKKAAPRKVAKKPAAKKVKKQKKVAVKPKQKPKPKTKPKKVLTIEQKARAELRVLKATALEPPANKPSSAWKVLLKEVGNDPSQSGKTVAAFSKAAATKYKSLSPEELEQYTHKASQNKLANNIALKEWTETHTPEEIRLANNARIQLKKRIGKPNSYSPLQDSRLPKRNRTPFILFAGDRWASGEFKGVKVTEASLLLRREYQALSDAERKIYEDRAGADKLRYVQEFKTVFHRDPGSTKKSVTA